VIPGDVELHRNERAANEAELAVDTGRMAGADDSQLLVKFRPNQARSG
jgi:hypothetical protein